MQKISRTDTVICSIYNTYHQHKKTMRIVMMAVNLLLFLYYLPFFNPTTWLEAYEGIWDEMYLAVNPFMTGAYILGMAILIQYIMYDNWIVKSLLSSFYGWIILVSLLVIMGMTRVWELCIYIPHLAMIILCCFVTLRKRKISTRDTDIV